MSNKGVALLAAAWLNQVQVGPSNPALTTRLAEELAGCRIPGCVLLLAALDGHPQLRDQVRIQASKHRRGAVAGMNGTCRREMPSNGHDVGNFLTSQASKGLCVLDYIGEEELRNLTRAVPVFDLTFLQASTPPEWAGEQVATAIAQGRRWVQDSLNSLYILLSPPQPLGTTLRSRSGALPHFSLQAEQGFGWDVEVLTQVDNDASEVCEVQVSVRHPEDVPANVEVTIRYSGASGDEWESAVTNTDGLVVFAAIPRAALDQLIIHLQASET